MNIEELKEKNFKMFLDTCEKVGVEELKMSDELSEKIKNATFSLTTDTKTAYDGSYLNVMLKVLIPYAISINDMLPIEMKINKKSIIKVGLFLQIAKAEMFMKNDNAWEVEKRHMVYKYAPNTLALKMGMRSVILAQEMGVTFTREEMEAMTIIDRGNDDAQANFFSSTLSVIIKQAYDLTMLQLRMLNKK